jgi:hypothetical protein
MADDRCAEGTGDAMANEKKPTQGAQRRFESLEGMVPATVAFPRKPDGAERSDEDRVEGTIVDISAGCLCLRVPMNQERGALMRDAGEGDPAELECSDVPGRRFTVLGHLAWVWVPSMEGDDVIGSLGITVTGVIEDDQRWIGKVKRLLDRERPVEVDLEPKDLESPARRRQRRREEDAPGDANDDGGEKE